MSLQIETYSADDSAHVAQTTSAYGITAEQFSALRQRAVAAKSTAYCPYSKFRVGASLLTHEGAYIDGANVENAAYPVGTCAERVAFGKAVTEGHKKFKAVAVATDISPPASPCGMCRQLSVPPSQKLILAGRSMSSILLAQISVGLLHDRMLTMVARSIREFCELDTPIIMFDKDAKYVILKLEQLLPLSFGPEALLEPAIA
ncbi:hypothetical protein BP6252_07981 [Coleophoma cylindrospora]|uniref:CMP/dCMP-type deaminase domain-containing protein n=1 Tax=Coleophoma cylindrospora TaxID=1849047 RepID=A0A3D8RBX7_9HELO|nr:hypothetical protein BP6252_07981 [Coleophoma cylindrospora]